MRNILLSSLIYLYCSSIVYAQSFDTTKATIFLNQVLKTKFNDTTNLKIYLVAELYNTIYPSESRRQEAYKELKQYIPVYEIDKQLEFCSLLSNKFKWINESVPFEVISDNEASELVENSSIIIVDTKNEKSKFNKKSTKNYVIVKTSAPLFIDENICLILLSSTSGNTTGTSCLYLFKKQDDGFWREEKVVLCSHG